MTIKTLTLIFSLFIGAQAIGQEVFNVKNQTQNNIKLLSQKIEKVMPEAKFTKNQLVKLEKIYLDMNKEKETLIKSGIAKHDYAKEVQRLDEKYKPLITAVLTTEQKIALSQEGNSQSH